MLWSIGLYNIKEYLSYVDLLTKSVAKIISTEGQRRKENKPKSMSNNFTKTDYLLYMKFNLDYFYLSAC